MTPAARLKRDIAYHIQVAVVEIERCLELIEPELTQNKSTYRLNKSEAVKIKKVLDEAIKCIKHILINL